MSMILVVKRTRCVFSYQKFTLFIFTRFATSVPHREILFQNDGYTAKGTVQLRVNEFGVFYVFVDIDRYNRVSVEIFLIFVKVTKRRT